MARKETVSAPQHNDVDRAALEDGAGALVQVGGAAAQVVEMMGYEIAYNRYSGPRI